MATRRDEEDREAIDLEQPPGPVSLDVYLTGPEEYELRGRPRFSAAGGKGLTPKVADTPTGFPDELPDRRGPRKAGAAPSREQWVSGTRDAVQAVREALGRPGSTLEVGEPTITSRTPADAPSGPGGGPIAARELQKMVMGGAGSADPEAITPPRRPLRPAAGPLSAPSGELATLRETLARPSPLDSLPMDDIRGAQRQDAVSRGMGRVSDALYGAFTRTAPQFRERGENATGELLQRRAVGEQDRARAERAAEADPASEASLTTQALIRSSMPGVAAELGPALEKLSHAKAMQVFPFLRDIAGKRAAAEAARAAAEAKAAGEKDRRAWEGGENEKDRKSRERAAWLANQRKDAAAAGKAARGQDELEAPGFERGPDAPAIKREEAAGFRTAVAAARELSGSSAKMRALIEAHGSELYGTKRAEMAALSRDMLLKMKDMAKLGVLSKSDEDILNDLIPNPTGIGGALTRKSSMLSQLDAFEDSVRRKLSSSAYSLGYRPVQKGQAEAPTGGEAGEAVSVVEERAGKGGRILQKMSDGSLRVKAED